VRDVPTSDPNTAAELATIADNVEQYRRRVGDLAERYVGTERDDVIAAIHEAERLLRSAERGLLRAVRAAR
jgi:cob(I)alamin adenosyltransferase